MRLDLPEMREMLTVLNEVKDLLAELVELEKGRPIGG